MTLGQGRDAQCVLFSSSITSIHFCLLSFSNFLFVFLLAFLFTSLLALLLEDEDHPQAIFFVLCIFKWAYSIANYLTFTMSTNESNDSCQSSFTIRVFCLLLNLSSTAQNVCWWGTAPELHISPMTPSLLTAPCYASQFIETWVYLCPST